MTWPSFMSEDDIIKLIAQRFRDVAHKQVNTVESMFSGNYQGYDAIIKVCDQIIEEKDNDKS